MSPFNDMLYSFLNKTIYILISQFVHDMTIALN